MEEENNIKFYLPLADYTLVPMTPSGVYQDRLKLQQEAEREIDVLG